MINLSSRPWYLSGNTNSNLWSLWNNGIRIYHILVQ